MTVSAPPRPPSPARAAPDSQPLERDEIEALVEALIEEARRETRRRHRRYWAVAALVAFVGVVVLILLDGDAASQTTSPAVSARINAPAQAGTSKIAFLRNPASAIYNGDLELWVMNPDGGGQRRVAAGARFPAWSPDGKSIAFSSERNGNRDIYVVRSDGTDERRLTRSPTADWGAASWSPDGQTIAFDRNGDVYVMNADGTGERRLTRSPARDLSPTWSPDGRLLLVRRDPGGLRPGEPARLYAINPDGGGLRPLRSAWLINGTGSWSPDGRKIVFSRWRDGNSDVYVMNSDGTGLRRLTRDPDADAIPAWSPDGRKIAFVEGPPWGAPGYGPRELWVMNSDGSGKRKLTGSDVAPDSAVSWSPDSRTIAYGAFGDVYAVDAAGAGRRNLTQRPGFDADPVWSARRRS